MKMLRLTLFLFICGIVYSAKIKTSYNLAEAENYFNDFVKQYNRQYDHEERSRRLAIFTENLKEIIKLNELNPHAVFGINKFTDMTKEEIGLKPLDIKYKDNHYCEKVTGKDINTSSAPDTFDWRSKNVVTPVKDQARCGSCYAFSTIGNIEGQYAIKTGNQELFSEQQLVDCSKRNGGCGGGYMTDAMSDIIDFKGLATEKSYPYVGEEGKCHFDESQAAVKLQGCNYYSLEDENKLKELLYSTGPIAVAIDAGDAVHYRKGIITNCNFMAIDHAVLLVGYGTENNVDYWLIKNSWGQNYGEAGYLRLVRGKNCNGILNDFMANAVVA